MTSIFLFISSAFSALMNCIGEKKDVNDYILVNWIPSNKDVSGIYMLNKNHHEDLLQDSIFLKLDEDNKLFVKIFFTLNLARIL